MAQPQHVTPTAYGATPRPGSAFELYSWLFMRISGILLVLLAVGHMAIMHVFVDVADVDYQFVAGRLALPLWRLYDMVLLVLALVHGLNGLRIVIDDYVHARAWRVFALSGLYVLGTVFLIVGAMVLLTFQPVEGALR